MTNTITTTSRIRRYERLAGVDHPRCSGCGWPPELLGSEVFVDLDGTHHRGTLVRTYDNFPIAAINDLVLCSECTTKAALLLDPKPGERYRKTVEALKGELADELAALTRRAKEQSQAIERKKQEIAEREAAREKRVALDTAAQGWLSDWDAAVAGLQESRLKAWMLERAVKAGDDWAAEDLGTERKALTAAKRKLTVLRKMGAPLRAQCAEKGLDHLATPIWERLNRKDDE